MLHLQHFGIRKQNLRDAVGKTSDEKDIQTASLIAERTIRRMQEDEKININRLKCIDNI